MTTILHRVLAAVLLAGMVATSALADTPADIARKVSPSVVLLVMQDANGQQIAMGSGFVVREGVIATNLHVIGGAARGYARLVGREARHEIRGIVASDAARDLVLLSVAGIKAKPLSIGDSNRVAAGDEVYAVADPRGLTGLFSAGIVGSIRKVGNDSLLQITARIWSGGSGGPVVNSKGEVIGVAVAAGESWQNLNFAIPSIHLSALLAKEGQATPLAVPDEDERERLKTAYDRFWKRIAESVRKAAEQGDAVKIFLDDSFFRISTLKAI